MFGRNVHLHHVVTFSGVHIPENRIWDYVFEKAAIESSTNGLSVTPTLYGERHAPTLKASITGIESTNLSMGTIFYAVCIGVIKNLMQLMPLQQLAKAEIDSVMACGSLINKNPFFINEVRKQLPLPVLKGNAGDAAYGAALAGLTEWNNLR